MDSLSDPNAKEAVAKSERNTEWLEWSQIKKDKRVDAVNLKLTGFMDDLNVSPETRDAFVKRYLENADRYRNEIPGSAHDEYHMAKVVDWAIQIYNTKKDLINQDKRKIFGMALISAAINHDIGDVPQSQADGTLEPFFISQRSEARSAEMNTDFLKGFKSEQLGVDADELVTLSALMVLSTCVDLEFDFNFARPADIDQLGIAKLIDKEFGEGQGYEPSSNKPRVVEIASRAQRAISDLKTKYRWDRDDLKVGVRSINSADYASYFFEKSYFEAAALLVEAQEEIVFQDGKLTRGPVKKLNYIDWLNPEFNERVYGLYRSYFPEAEATEMLSYRTKMYKRITEAKKRNAEEPDRIFRLESALLPSDLLELVYYYSNLADRPAVADSVLAYSGYVRQSADNPDFTKISGPSSDAIEALYKGLDGEVRNNFIDRVLIYAMDELAAENSGAYIHIAPGRYDVAGEKSIVEHVKEVVADDPTYFERIAGIYLTYRLDKDNPLQLKEYIRQAKNFPKMVVGVAIGGANPMYENIRESIEIIRKSKFFGPVMVHSGLEANPQEAIKIYELVAEARKSGVNVELHLSAGFDTYLAWLKTKSMPEDSINLIASPLINGMQDSHNLDTLAEIEKLTKRKVGLGTNGSRVLTPPMGISMQKIAAGHV